MSILRGLHIVLWIIAFTAAAVAYDWHLRQVSDHVAEAQDLAQKLTDAEELYQAAKEKSAGYRDLQRAARKLELELGQSNLAYDMLLSRIPEPVTNPDPMSATVKLSIAGGGHGSATHIGNGYLITAGHVAENEGDTLTARFENGDEYEAVTLWSNSRYDIALVKIEATDAPASNLECRTPEPGEQLRFLGNPLAMEWVTTRGYVAGPATGAYSKAWDTVLPVDAAMAGGMSGGGSFDADGDLVGVNVGIPIQQFSWGDGSATGISFVVPAETLCGLLART